MGPVPPTGQAAEQKPRPRQGRLGRLVPSWTEPGQDPGPQRPQHFNCCVQTTRSSWTFRAQHGRQLRICTPGFAMAAAQTRRPPSKALAIPRRKGKKERTSHH